MICRHCGCENETVGFKTTCDDCNEFLHSCFQCNLFDSNTDRCRSLTTEAVSDLTGNNYCEEFVQNTDPPPGADFTYERKAPGTGDDFNALFGKSDGD